MNDLDLDFRPTFGRAFIIGTIAAAILALGLLSWAISVVAWSATARAHDEHDWIRKGGFKDINGYGCCDPTDCKVIPTSAVEELADGGFRYRPTDEIIPRAETRPSPDGQYWRCHWHLQGQERTRRLCFWRPVPPS